MGQRMMPGQEPYTDAEAKRLSALVDDAAAGDPGEQNEPYCPGCDLHEAERVVLEPFTDEVCGETLRCPACGDLYEYTTGGLLWLCHSVVD